MTSPTPNLHRFRLSKEVFDRCKDLHGEALEGALVAECGEDEELRTEVERLIQMDRASHALDVPPLLDELVDDAPMVHPERIGPFVVERFLGSGGSGSVYLARQGNPPRRVAVKLLNTGGELAARRFNRESRALAVLNHPGVVRILDAGVDVEVDTRGVRHGSGRPYIVMEYVDGEPITKYAARMGLELHAKIELFTKVCDAVAHAHSKGVIHRDLKPANILVNIEDGQPRVVDFGIARILSGGSGGSGGSAGGRVTELLTADSSVLGTLEYMSPECLTGNVGSADTRADVYSLGSVLYELVTGVPPRDLSDMSLIEAVRSAADETVGALRVSARAPNARGDIESIVQVATERLPSRRYQTVDALSADLRRYLSREPILARPPRWPRRVMLWALRHKAGAAGLAVIAAVLVSAAGMVWQASEREREKYRLAMDAVGALDDMISFMQPHVGTIEQRRRVLDEFLPAVESLVERMGGQGAEGRADERILSLYARLLGARADLHAETGRRVSVLQDRERAAEIFERLVKRNPDDPELVWGYSIALIKMGDELGAMGVPDRALAGYERALEVQETAKARLALTPSMLDDVTWSYVRVGYVHWTALDLPRASLLASRAVETAQENLVLFPERAASWWGMMAAQHMQARLRLTVGDVDGYANHLACAEEIGQMLVDKNPGIRLFMRESLRMTFQLALFNLDKGMDIEHLKAHLRRIEELANKSAETESLYMAATAGNELIVALELARSGDERAAAEKAEDVFLLFHGRVDESETMESAARVLAAEPRMRMSVPPSEFHAFADFVTKQRNREANRD